jgi:hypothetical protein
MGTGFAIEKEIVAFAGVRAASETEWRKKIAFFLRSC